MTKFNEVFKRLGLKKSNEMGDDWKQVNGQMSFVATAEQGLIWSIDGQGDAWTWNLSEISIEEIIDNTKENWTLVSAS